MNDQGVDQETQPAAADKANIFDIESLRLPVGFEDPSTEASLQLQVRKPKKQEFIRIKKDANYWLDTFILKVDADGSTYLVDRDLWSELEPEIKRVRIFTVASQFGAVFLWPLRPPLTENPTAENPWILSAWRGAQIAMDRWVRLSSDRGARQYRILEAQTDLGEPKWPTQPFDELLHLAFGSDYLIRNLSHPVIRRLWGYTP